MNIKVKKMPAIPLDILQQASEWQAKLWSDEVQQQDLNSCLKWREANPEHERAWQFISQFDHQLQHLSQSQQNVLRDSPLGDIASLIKKGSMLCLLLGFSFWTYQQNLISILLADYSTQNGEVKKITLADGTKLVLDTNSAINVDYKDNERDIFLIKGQVWVETGHKYQHFLPLHVHYSGVEIQPLGTQFTVSDHHQNLNIAVYEGRVQIRSKQMNPPLILQSNMQVSFDPKSSPVQFQKADDLDLAWKEQKLIVEQMPICEFMQYLKEYRSGYIYCDSNLTNVKVSGTYNLKQSEQILENLPKILPIKVQYYTPYLLRLSYKSN